MTLLSAEGAHCASPAAAAIWFVYDVQPQERAEGWAQTTYDRLASLAGDARTGVSMIEFRCVSRGPRLEAPPWASACAPRTLRREELSSPYGSGYAVTVPLMDTPVYLRYLRERLVAAGGRVEPITPLAGLRDVPEPYGIVVNCSGFGARTLVGDRAMRPHRGQVVLVERPPLAWAIVCEEDLMYVIPRASDCVLGGTSSESDDVAASDAETETIRRGCATVLNVDALPTREVKVGVRPFRDGGIRLERGRLDDGRAVIHNYGHGGSGFTVSWGCAEEVVKLAAREA